IWLSLSFILVALSSTQSAILRRDLAFKNLAARSLTATIVGGIVGVGMAIAGFGVWSLVGMNLARGMAGVIVLWQASDWRPRLHISKKHYKELFSFGISITGNNVLRVLVRRSDDFLIGYFLGPTMLGFYTIGYRLLLMIIRLVTGIINSVAFPTFSRIQHNPIRMRGAFYKVTQYTNLLAFPVFIGLALLASKLIPALFGAEWAQSIPIMQILALSGILQGVLLLNGSVLKATGKPSWQFGIMLVTAVCSVIGFLLAVRWGIIAVAAAFVIVSYLMAPISYIAVRRQIQVDVKSYLGKFALPLFASLIMILVIVGLKYVIEPQGLHAYAELFVYIVAGAVTYTLVVGLTAPSILRQVVDLTSPLLPRWNLRGIFKYVR
ncbi:MAG: lipopolysaccharide biosynthesis protein, partial [Anaerolineaceae bacterium]